jgi:branched-chain amino acid transport system ATP-binding protein
MVSIIGPNGSGKSTLLKAIVGLLRPMNGTVLLDGKDVTGWAPHRVVREGLGYVPQGQNVFPSLNVVENLQMGAFSMSQGIGVQVERVLNEFPDLSASRRKKAGDLSVGQRNLLGVARALMLQPRVVLVDEPTSGLAPDNTKLMWQQLVRIRTSGAAVVVVEQNVDMALEHSDWCYVLRAGRALIDGPASAIRLENLDAIFLGATHIDDGEGWESRRHSQSK